MKNIMFVDGAANCVYDMYSATDEEFAALFPGEQDIAFEDELIRKHDPDRLGSIFKNILSRPIAKREAMGVHGILYDNDLADKKQYYPNCRDEDAINPDGSRLRHNGAWRPPVSQDETLKDL